MSGVLPKTVLYYGKKQSIAEGIPLTAGPVSMLFEPQNAFLRYIRLGEIEILRGVYVAVREDSWGTVTPVLSNLEINAESESFNRAVYHDL